MRLRRAGPEDAEAWNALWDEVGSEGIYLIIEKAMESLEKLRASFAQGDPALAAWLVAEVQGRLVGAADIRRGGLLKTAHTAGLGIAVRKEFRGLGVGEAIMRAGIDWSREVGIKKLKLGVFATNDRAIGLYRKLGFVEEGRLRGEALIRGKPVDEVLMALWL